MKIAPINQNLPFMAGEVKILSDFDGTFMPDEFNHDVICNGSKPLDKDAFNSYFDEFQRFLSSTDDGKKTTELTISTGRNLSEFNYYMKKIKDKGLRIPVPDKLIVVNGGDEFIKSKKPDFFSSDREDMFEESDINLKKQKQLRRFVINWDGFKIKDRVKAFISRLSGCPMLIEPPTHQGMYGYRGDMTLQEDVQALPDEDKTNYISLRQDGNSLIRLTAPVGSAYIEELKGLKDELEQEGYKIVFQTKKHNGETFVNSVSDNSNWQLGTSIEIKPETRGKVKKLDKFHHAKLMVDEIMQKGSNDLVIVCGDGRNDLNMLSIENYLDTDISDYSTESTKTKIQNLPLRSIFIRNNSSLDDTISKFEQIYNFDGHKRFIVVDKNDETKPHTLLEAIKIAKEDYSSQNPEFKRNNQ